MNNHTPAVLSFSNVRERERTKHVHRLHPYKGKFIPQLVEYFLDTHTDEFKQEVYFKKGDTIIDPFCGSGTTLVQANELSINAIGIDISEFNTLISNCKLATLDLDYLKATAKYISDHVFTSDRVREFEAKLTEALSKFNKEIAGPTEQFLPTYLDLVEKYDIDTSLEGSSFLSKWFFKGIRQELKNIKGLIDLVTDDKVLHDMLVLIASRTMRSCRATTHSDLATLDKPVFTPYYCRKHSKICRPIFTAQKWWDSYTDDTIERLREFSKLRTDTKQVCLTGDSRTIDLYPYLDGKLADGVFSSPPYVGLIDYHEQHAYAYELFNLDRRDAEEIGSLSSGQTKKAQEDYVNNISQVLINMKRFLKDGANIFLVANDKFDLYPKIATLSGLNIITCYNRPVTKRSEAIKQPYSETIYHMRKI